MKPTLKTAIAMSLFVVGCTNSGNSGDSGGSEPPANPPTGSGGACVAIVPDGADNLTIAKAFAEYRLRCNPSESELEAELEKLELRESL